jgi:hypothetical protein
MHLIIRGVRTNVCTVTCPNIFVYDSIQKCFENNTRGEGVRRKRSTSVKHKWICYTSEIGEGALFLFRWRFMIFFYHVRSCLQLDQTI